VVASGGVSNITDIKKLSNVEQLEGVIVGKAIYDNTISLHKLLKFHY
jgi:phosphoribosylformimino-5-aminoimidazole carboxamide ribotide isomerase